MGAGAIVYACIYLPTTPIHPLTFDFTPTSDACMNDGGSAQSLTASDAGVSSVKIGYVESKVSGCKCLSAKSYWSLAYAVKDTPYSGSVKTRWYCPPEYNEITLDSPGTTTVNTSAARSSNTSQQWHGMGSIYIVFSPLAKELLAGLPLLKFFTPPERHGQIDDLYRPLMEGHYLERSNPFFSERQKTTDEIAAKAETAKRKSAS